MDIVKRSKQNLEENVEYQSEETKSHKRDQVIILILLGLWIVYVTYTYFA